MHLVLGGRAGPGDRPGRESVECDVEVSAASLGGGYNKHQQMATNESSGSGRS
jgi:hypothetical protein